MRRCAPIGCFGIAALIALSSAADTPAHDYMVASDGVKIHYMSLGEGTPVVLIHGYTANADDKWFGTGVAPYLAERHRVIAIDCRGHGRSDKPHDPAMYGPQMAEDVIELMDHLGIDEAHVHGFSMGGGIVTQLLDRHQDRLITASYGGSGVREVDPEWIAKVPADLEGENPGEQAGSQALRDSPYRDQEALDAVRAYDWKDGERGRIDLTTVTVPVLSINGGFDRPNARTHRMKREIQNFHSWVLPDRGHLTTVGEQYTKILSSFVDLWDPGAAPTEGTLVASDGTDIHYWEMGRGTPVVLIHGFSGSGQLWLSNGVANALKKDHRVVVIDCRGHGESAKPHDPERYGPQMADDVIELMDHLGIDKAHVHGYSMGGGIVTQLLARYPERVITAAYGGSGVREVDEERVAEVPADAEGPDPLDDEARKMLQASPTRDEAALAAIRAFDWQAVGGRRTIDLTAVTVPVLAINGEYDGFHAKTHRMERELADFTNVMLPGKSHLSAIEPGYIPDLYVEATVIFVRDHEALDDSVYLGMGTTETEDGKRSTPGHFALVGPTDEWIGAGDS